MTEKVEMTRTSDLIHTNELIDKLHDTAFKDGDDRSICYSVIRSINPVAEPDVSENISLKNQLDAALKAVEYNSNLVEQEKLKHELYRKDGEIQGLRFAIRCLTDGKGRK